MSNPEINLTTTPPIQQPSALQQNNPSPPAPIHASTQIIAQPILNNPTPPPKQESECTVMRISSKPSSRSSHRPSTQQKNENTREDVTRVQPIDVNRVPAHIRLLNKQDLFTQECQYLLTDLHKQLQLATNPSVEQCLIKRYKMPNLEYLKTHSDHMDDGTPMNKFSPKFQIDQENALIDGSIFSNDTVKAATEHYQNVFKCSLKIHVDWHNSKPQLPDLLRYIQPSDFDTEIDRIYDSKQSWLVDDSLSSRIPPAIQILGQIGIEALRENNINLTTHIFNHLHCFGIEDYLKALAEKELENAGVFETRNNRNNAKHSYNAADRYYHVLCLMHPFNIQYYNARVNIFHKLRRKDFNTIYAEAMKNIKDPHLNDLIKLESSLKLIGTPIGVAFQERQANNMIDKFFELAENFQQSQLPLNDLYYLIVQGFVKFHVNAISHSNDSSVIPLCNLIKKSNEFTKRFFGNDLIIIDHVSIFPRQILGLVSLQPFSSTHLKSYFLRFLAMPFHEMPGVITFLRGWHKTFHMHNEYASFIGQLKPPPQIDLPYSHFYNSEITKKDNIKLTELINSYQTAKSTAGVEIETQCWSAFNLGKYYLEHRMPELALDLFKEAAESGDHIDHLLGLWACYVICNNKDKAREILAQAASDNEIYTQRIANCWSLQKAIDSQKHLYFVDILHAAGLIVEGPSVKIAEIRDCEDQVIKNWIKQRSIPLSGGYIGTFIYKNKAVNLKDCDRDHCNDDNIKKYYYDRIEKKLKEEPQLLLPMGRKDEWVGDGKKQPRIDIEEYYARQRKSAGDSRFHQRFRFQQGDLTFGGLRLPISLEGEPSHYITIQMILEAYQKWAAKQTADENVYLVVSHPAYVKDLNELYEEIYYMDRKNKKKNG